jgi:hypothetical protein
MTTYWRKHPVQRVLFALLLIITSLGCIVLIAARTHDGVAVALAVLGMCAYGRLMVGPDKRWFP